MLQSGILAKRVGVNKQTIRYYERLGLIRAETRNESGYRFYSEQMVERIQFIKSAKTLGFSLDEIQELLDFRIDNRSNCDTVREKAQSKRNEIQAKIRELKRMDRVLAGLIESCETRSPTNGCPILAFSNSRQERKK